MQRRAGAVLAALSSLWLAAPVFAAPVSRNPSLMAVEVSSPADVPRLVAEGFDVVSARGTLVKILGGPGTQSRLLRMGLSPRLLDPDPGAAAAARNRAELERMRLERRAAPGGTQRVSVIPPFGQGSLGGFWTNPEVQAFLDSVVADDPNDLVADKLDTLGITIRGRPVIGVLLGKQDGGLSSRPAFLVNALTHAREPQGLQSTLYFAHWLLSGYGSDPEATYLLDHRRIYLCPIVNPDGYALNESLYVANSAFGFWRKNARDTYGFGIVNYSGAYGDSCDGVDLNRNFSYQWGIPNGGSSSDPTNQTYRGPASFSEPETQIQRSLVDALQPKTGISFHTYSDFYLFPWGYTAAAPPDSSDFFDWSFDATENTHLMYGQAPRVLYAVNGEFNDWMYGETVEKPRAYSWTPELGNEDDFFWPPPSRILPLSELTLRLCKQTAYLAGAWVRVKDVEAPNGPLIRGGQVQLRLLLRNKGVGESSGSGLTATMTPISAGIQVLPGTVAYPDVAPRSDALPTPDALFWVTADDTVTAGRKVRLRVDFTTPAGYFSRDTVELVVGQPTQVYGNDAESGLADWSPGLWGIVNNDPTYASNHFTDSPTTNYANNANNALTLTPPLDLSAGVHAYAELVSRWSIEQDWDALLVEASLNGVNWVAVPGQYTKPGSGIGGSVQPMGSPLFDGNNYQWKPERIDLSAFTGPAATAVRLRFRLVSDVASRFDGFRFDNLKVMVYDPSAQPVVAADAGSAPARLFLSIPSPARGAVDLSFEIPAGAGPVRLELLDLLGRHVRLLASGEWPVGRHQVRWDGTGANGAPSPSGIYFARLSNSDRAEVRRLAFIR